MGLDRVGWVKGEPSQHIQKGLVMVPAVGAEPIALWHVTRTHRWDETLEMVNLLTTVTAQEVAAILEARPSRQVGKEVVGGQGSQGGGGWRIQKVIFVRRAVQHGT